MTDEAILRHILIAIERVELYAQGGSDAFLADTRTQDAIMRNLEIIGEAVKSLSNELKAEYPDIPWRQISGMRDFLIHVYFGVNLNTVWQTVATDIGPLKSAIVKALADFGKEVDSDPTT